MSPSSDRLLSSKQAFQGFSNNVLEGEIGLVIRWLSYQNREGPCELIRVQLGGFRSVQRNL